MSLRNKSSGPRASNMRTSVGHSAAASAKGVNPLSTHVSQGNLSTQVNPQARDGAHYGQGKPSGGYSKWANGHGHATISTDPRRVQRSP